MKTKTSTLPKIYLSSVDTSSMPDVIPTLLLPYVEGCLQSPALTLVTSTLSTPGNWLLTRFLHAALHSNGGTSTLRSQSSVSTISHPSVVFVSVLHPLELWNELGKKNVSLLQALIRCTLLIIQPCDLHNSIVKIEKARVRRWPLSSSSRSSRRRGC